MSVEVTTLLPASVVVTDTMPHLESASLGVWVHSGSRDERPDEHGISHFLEHMAFKGTARRSARQIAEEIEAVGGDLNAATGVERRPITPACSRPTCRSALDVLVRHPVRAGFDREEIVREQNVIVQEIGAVADTPDDLVFEHLKRRLSGPAGRPLDPRHAEDGALVRRASGCATISAAIIARPTWWSRPPAPWTTRRWSPRRRSGSPASSGPATRRRSRRDSRGGAHRREARARAGAHRAGAAGVPQTDPSLFSLQVFTNVLGGGMSSRLFQEVRESAGCATRSMRSTSPYADTGMFGLYAGTDASTRPN